LSRLAANSGLLGDNAMSVSDNSTDNFTFTQFRDYVAETHPEALAVPDGDAVRRYVDVVERFASDGDVGALMEGLMQLGVDAASIRWHARNRGSHLTCMIYGD
jgi:hypothetical protein